MGAEVVSDTRWILDAPQKPLVAFASSLCCASLDFIALILAHLCNKSATFLAIIITRKQVVLQEDSKFEVKFVFNV